MGAPAPRPTPLQPYSAPSCRAGLSTIAVFVLAVALLSVALSAIATPLFGLSWWKTLRRCVSISAVLSLWYTVRVVQRLPFRAYGFVPLREGQRHVRFGLAVGAAALGVLCLLGLWSGLCRIDVTPDRARLWRTLLLFVPGALLVSVVEELVFRGMLLRNLLGCSRWFAVSASSVAYALVHLREPAVTWLIWQELAGLTLFGVVLALSALRTRQLWLAIGLHAALAYGARVNKLVCTFPPDPAWSWFTGTSRLVNGVAGWIALVVIGALVVWWTTSTQQRRVTG